MASPLCLLLSIPSVFTFERSQDPVCSSSPFIKFNSVKQVRVYVYCLLTGAQECMTGVGSSPASRMMSRTQRLRYRGLRDSLKEASMKTSPMPAVSRSSSARSSHCTRRGVTATRGFRDSGWSLNAMTVCGS